MNKLTYILMVMVGALMFASCSEGNSFIADVENGTNLASFSAYNMSVEKVAHDDSVYTVEVPMKIEGPSVQDLSGDVTVSIELMNQDGIPEDERAKLGTHFSFEKQDIVLKKSDNYLGNVTFTMLAEGITPPLDNTKTFRLKATGVSGGGNVVNSAKPIEITLDYACPSNLQGTYDVVVTSDGGDEYIYTGVKITKDEDQGLGTYISESISIGPYGPGDVVDEDGLIFTDDCGTLTVPSQDLEITEDDVKEVKDFEDGEVNGNSQTGVLTSFTLKYSIENVGKYTAVYTKQ